ncbi:MAG: anti-sigma factor family protein [Armatimonadota bacterium]
MKCWLVRRRLFSYQDGDLPERQRAQVQQHLRACPACAAQLARLCRTVDLVETLERVQPRPDFTAEVMRAVRAQPAPQPATAPPSLRPVGALLGFAGCLLSVALVLIAVSLDWGALGLQLADLAPSLGVVAEVLGLALTKLLLGLEAGAQALAQPVVFVLVADIILLTLLLAIGRRLTARRSVGVSVLAM